MDGAELGVEAEDGTIKPIQSNNKKVCLHCGVAITADNDSGWEQFTAESKGRETQKVCKTCNAKTAKGPQLKKEDS